MFYMTPGGSSTTTIVPGDSADIAAHNSALVLPWEPQAPWQPKMDDIAHITDAAVALVNRIGGGWGKGMDG